MRRERIILALVAILAGIIIASSFFYFYQQKGPQREGVGVPSPTSAPNGKIILEIESPQPYAVTDKKTIEVKGKAQARALIILTTNTEDFVLDTGEGGSFEKNVTLEEDENVLTVTSYPENGTSETKELVVTYTTEEF